ncbi:MAG TPA: OmpA family protein [Bryobacteraceae bacterium]|nr:OmpA family protein [Bryobacteraceae bacterium]
MGTNWLARVLVALLLVASGCARKQAPLQPPPPRPETKQNIVVLLPDPAGKPSAIELTNQAGTQTLSQPYEAVHWAGNGAAPGAPSAMDPSEVKRIFGAALDVLPQPEVSFLLYFGEGSEVLLAESRAELPAIFSAIRERKSTSITVIGHTDTTATPDFNYQLGLRRARGVAGILRDQGVRDSDLFITSHGEADLAVKTPRGTAERLNRRVEVIVR